MAPTNKRERLEAFENTNTLATLLVWVDRTIGNMVLTGCRLEHHNDSTGEPVWHAYAEDGREWHFRTNEVNRFNREEIVLYGYTALTPRETEEIVGTMKALGEAAARLEDIKDPGVPNVERNLQESAEAMQTAWNYLHRALWRGGAIAQPAVWPGVMLGTEEIREAVAANR